MFDLEKAIAVWRRKLDDSRAFLPDDVDELEGHLCDHIEALKTAGTSEEAAFHAAVRRLGEYGNVEAEYRKVRWTKLRHRHGLRRELNEGRMMLTNYLKIALRNLKQHKAYTAINVTGLAVGMACCLLLLLYVQHELVFDRFHDHADRIIRLGRLAAYPDEIKRFANTGAAAAPTLKAEFPAVEKMVRIMPSYPQDLLVSHGDQRFYETTFFWADSTVFDVFSFSLKRGDPRTALTEPFTIVLTEAMARKYFGDEDPMGKTLTAHHWTTHDYTVTGILEEVPATSHLQFDFLASMVGEEPLYPWLFDGEGQWSNSLSFAYLLLSDADAAATLEPQLADFAKRHMGEFAAGRGFVPGFLLQPLKDIHLHSDLSNEIGVVSDIRYVYLFSAIAFLILVIACINFMNLATARAAERAKEVGIRKVLGAYRGQLIRQFFSESVLLTLIALLVAVALLYLLLPIFNQVSGLSLSLTATSARWLLLGLLGVSVFVGVVAGSYPALYLSSFRPVGVLKGAFKTSAAGVMLRKGLVVFQFAVSMVLIAGTLVILSQLDYLRSKPLGFEKEQIVVLPFRADVLREQYETIKQDLAQHPGVVELAAAAGTPGNQGLIDRFPVRPASAPETEQRPMYIIGADYDYLDLLGLHLIAGRDFSKAYPTDATEAFIINETAAEDLGWDDPIGKEIYLNVDEGKRGTIIGEVHDFHFQSLHLPIEPAVLTIWPGRFTALN
ncbi:MAG TPA: ABC transporter permease, partial [Rhodothermales bacterium]|nr:ABC transporter permease [Rhodothermales bacterium]